MPERWSQVCCAANPRVRNAANIRARRQDLALQELPWQKETCKIYVIVSKRYRYTPPPGTVWLFGDNCDTCSLRPNIVFWATQHPWRKRMVSFLPARTTSSEVQKLPHLGKMHAWE